MDERHMNKISKVHKIGIKTMLNVVDKKLTHLPRQTS